MQLAQNKNADNYLISPDINRLRLSRCVVGHDHLGVRTEISVVEERPLTIYLNSQEIVTAMTIGDYPDYLALGFLLNQGMLGHHETVTDIDYDEAEALTTYGIIGIKVWIYKGEVFAKEFSQETNKVKPKEVKE